MSAENSQIDPSIFTPKTKKTMAKKTVQKLAAAAAEKASTKAAAKTAQRLAVKAGTKTAAKVATKSAGKVAAKTFLVELANPWLLVADGVELGAEALCRNQLGLDRETTRTVKKVSGLGASLTIGAVAGGPLGAAAGGALWAVGEGLARLFGWD